MEPPNPDMPPAVAPTHGVTRGQPNTSDTNKLRRPSRAGAGAPGIDEMLDGRERKYYMVGGKGGVGKTSLSSSLAVKFASAGHKTLVVSTDPAHSLSDSLAQNVRGGQPVEVNDTDGMLYALEIDPESAKAEFTQFARATATIVFWVMRVLSPPSWARMRLPL